MNRRGKTVAIWVGVAAATGGLALLIWQRRVRKQKRFAKAGYNKKRNNNTTSVDTTTTLEFHKAAESARELKNLQNGDKIMLYGLYKQATVVGGCDESKEPSRLNVMEHAKYEGWMKFQGMSSEDAMKHYIQAIEAFTSGEVMEYQTEELDMHNAMGLRPSKMVQEEEDDEDDTNNSTPMQQLRLAAREGDIEKLKEALRCEAQVDATDDSGQTALHFAADRGFLEGVEVLLEAGADANAVDLDGIGVLQAAVIAGHAHVASLLLQNGANADQADSDGDTPRTCAHDDGSEEMRKLFTEVPTIE
jgi:acyl-CoA-binding protein